MHLIEILLPLKNADGNAFPAEFYDRLAQQLSERFGGVTGFFRSPAEGRWQSGGATEHDDIVSWKSWRIRWTGTGGRRYARR